MRRLVLLLLAAGFWLQPVSGAPGDGLTPGTRVLLDAHNAYPEDGRWADRVDRALSTGVPLAIEQDLVWYHDPATGTARSIVSHGKPFTGREPGLREDFFEKIRPIVERALREGNRDRWPLVTLNLDFKTDEPEHHAALWNLLGEYESWLCTAPRGRSAFDIQPIRPGPVLVLTGEQDSQMLDFFEQLPPGAPLRLFGAVHAARRPAGTEDELPALVEQLLEADRARGAAERGRVDDGRRAAPDDRGPRRARRRPVDQVLHARRLRSRRQIRRLGAELQLRLARRRHGTLARRHPRRCRFRRRQPVRGVRQGAARPARWKLSRINPRFMFRSRP
jgi:hypothetical protein